MSTEVYQLRRANWRYLCYAIYAMVMCTMMLFSCSQSEGDDPFSELTISDDQAAVTAVSCTGQPNNYTLSVTIASPDTGCDQYADWWEVLTPDSTLIYRRILGHSHVDEQPFARSGGVVDVGADEFIYVRAHMNNSGYGSLVFSGTVRDSLRPDTLQASYASGLEAAAPLPTNCAF